MWKSEDRYAQKAEGKVYLGYAQYAQYAQDI